MDIYHELVVPVRFDVFESSCPCWQIEFTWVQGGRQEFYLGGAVFSNDDVIDDVISCDLAKKWGAPLPPLPTPLLGFSSSLESLTNSSKLNKGPSHTP